MMQTPNPRAACIFRTSVLFLECRYGMRRSRYQLPKSTIYLCFHNLKYREASKVCRKPRFSGYRREYRDKSAALPMFPRRSISTSLLNITTTNLSVFISPSIACSTNRMVVLSLCHHDKTEKVRQEMNRVTQRKSLLPDTRHIYTQADSRSRKQTELSDTFSASTPGSGRK